MTSETLPSFDDLALSAPVLKALKQIGYEQPSPIQAESIPHLLKGEDILGTAQTGTGKTAAFALPILSNINIKQKQPQVLVLAPTRELAIQVAEAFQKYAGAIKGFHVLPIYGGQDMRGQLRQLDRGVHVIVGTPGRVMDHLRRGSLKLNEITTVVLDEADEMLRMGFIDDVTWILEHAPKERQVALFSATMPKEIQKVANNYLSNPHVIKIKSETSTVSSVEQIYWLVSGTNKLDALTRILEVEEFDGIIIFVRTKTATAELAERLEARGYSSGAINGDMSQQLRERTIERLKSSKIDIVVATDVAARGIDVPRVSHVINFDIPYDTEAYVHRIGRTGRAGRSGKAILFVAPRERRLLRAIEKATRQPISEISLPSIQEVSAQRITQFKNKITETLESGFNSKQSDFFTQLIQEYIEEHEIAPEKLASVLAFMSQGERQLLPEKEKRMERGNNDSGGRSDRGRNDRGDRGGRERKGRDRGDRDKGGRSDRGDENMQRFRIAVGRDHGATPGDIVGAIANEANLNSKNIGHIKLHDSYSTVDLPTDISKEKLQTLDKVYVRNQQLSIEKMAGGGERKHSEKRRSEKRKSRPASSTDNSDKKRNYKKPNSSD